MKAGIHPKYEETTIRCACGETVRTRSTKGKEIRVDICSSAIPSSRVSRSLWTAAAVSTDSKKTRVGRQN